MSVKIYGEGMKIEDIVKIARFDESIELSSQAKENVSRSRNVVETMFERKETAYGTTTGIGELASVFLTEEQAKNFSKFMIYSHSGGCGESASVEDTRATIASRINVLCKGVSGVRLEVVEFIADMLNRKVNPVMCKTSVGACGDLAPLAQAMLVPLGEGEAIYQGRKMKGADALKAAGLGPIKYEIRDGLAVINGSNLITGMATLEVYDSDILVKTSEIAAAMSFEALKAVMLAFDDEILRLRGFEGGIRCAENIRRLTEGSEILVKPERVQDAYSIRSTPQVVGTIKDALEYVRKQVEIELNAGADNPLFVPKESGYRYLAGANFQGTPIALPLEMLGTGIAMLSVISERRINRLLNPNLNAGLPGFLTRGAGMYSGIMIPQYTAASLVCENRVLSTPAAIGSIPTAADQEDFVSMGTNTAIKTRKIIDNTAYVIAIEMLAATQALDLRGGNPGKGVKAAYDLVRKYVKFLDEDRPLYPDIEILARLVKEGRFLEEAEKQIGLLK
ncbi:MAG: aromatic amino acid lyase [Candidatus Aenigmarchaeota archaeon]|nr:aromatic amino acid lyase [Candidatus Aenigmarchaeota archaeon]